MELIDSHAHLDAGQFASDLPQVLERARQKGLRYIVTVGTDLLSSIRAIELASRYSFVYTSIGVHPHHADKVEETALKKLKDLARQPKVVAIGETGLDYYRNYSPRPAQQKLFRELISMAKEVGLPLIIHQRHAQEELTTIMDEEEGWKAGGVMHCFSGSEEHARRCLEKGFYLSFAGNITFPKATLLRRVIKETPMERILIETDSPYLAPLPYRGRRNEPSYVEMVAEKIAELKGLSVEQCGRMVTANLRRVFKLG